MRVQVEYFSSYNMPSGCVACGNPVTPHTHSVGTSNWSGKQTVTLKFPLCEECNEAGKANRSAGWLGCLGGLLAASLGAGIGVVLNSLINGAGIEFAGALVGFTGGMVLSRRLVLSSKPPEVRERLARLNKSVRMIGFSLPSLFGGKGWIKLEFANPDYGNQFSMLNGGKA